MLDLQTVFFRDVAPVTAIDFVTMARVRRVDTASLVQVEIDHQPARYMLVGPQEIAIVLPNEQTLEDVASIRLVFLREGATSSELISNFGPAVASATARVAEDNTVLRLEGEDFRSAIDVRVANVSQKFTILSRRVILATIPPDLRLTALDDFPVDVVVSSKTITRSSFFSYQVGDQLRTMTGTFKATAQFIKVLMTTPGTDVFDPTGPAGDLQNWIGLQVASNARQSLLAKLVLSISTTAAKFVAQQQNAGVPPEERISSVDVVNVGQESPTSVTITLRIRTFKAQTAIFSLLLNSIEQVATNSASISG